MDYPFFDVPKLGGGMVVAIVAIVHVVIAHLAVGAGVFLAVAHTLGVRRGDAILLDFLRRYGRFLILLSFVMGALTGVGIWVTISLVSPPATSALIHLFVWGWAIEWVFFIVEIVSGYVYYYGWNRLTPRRHITVAWIYAVAAFMSLVIINGIVTFMLTPGSWLPPDRLVGVTPQQAFLAAVFNPTYWPSLLLRTISSLALAGMSVAIVVNCIGSYSRDQQQRIINLASWLLVPIGLMVPLAIWYFAVLSPASRDYALGGSIAMTLFFAFGLVSSLYIGAYAYWGLIRQRQYVNLQTSLLLFGVAFVATGAMEFVREGVRKPYLIPGYLYSNGIPVGDEWEARINRDGILTYARFAYPPDMTLEQAHDAPLRQLGEYVYRAECLMCHQPGGTNDIAPLINKASRELLTEMTTELSRLKGFMPPFMGTEREKRALVEYMLQLARPGGESLATAGAPQDGSAPAKEAGS